MKYSLITIMWLKLPDPFSFPQSREFAGTGFKKSAGIENLFNVRIKLVNGEDIKQDGAKALLFALAPQMENQLPRPGEVFILTSGPQPIAECVVNEEGESVEKLQTDSFKSIVHAALKPTRIGDLLLEKDAVILERTAMGGGATNWYYCPDKHHLEAVEAELSPGSVVSIYFDDRIQKALYSSAIRSITESIISETGDAVIGVLNEDQLHIDVEIVTGPRDIDEFESNIKSSSKVFFGAFPARDNNGTQAITVVLPDSDGIVRPHPH